MTKAERMAMEAYPPKIEYAGQPGLEFDINELNRIIYADAFKAGAEWQEEELERNRLAHCDNLTEKEYKMETTFVDEIIEKERRTPTFLDAIEYGMRLQKSKMLKDAEKGVIRYNEYDCMLEVCIPVGCPYHEGDKVKIVIVKEDKQ